MGETAISKACNDMIKREFADDIALDRHQCGNLNVRKRWIHMGKPGWADRLGFVRRGRHSGKFIGIEVKTLTGEQSPEQVEFQALCDDAGAIYLLVESVDDCRDKIKEALR